ncbi:sll1863 family stress response protein [Corallococcus sp. M7]
MTERDAYIQKMEAEQREATARFREIEAQADLADSEDTLDVLTGARAFNDDVNRELQALRRADERDWERLKSGAEKARGRFREHLDHAGTRWEALREGYQRQREAELKELGAQMDGWIAAHKRTRAEDSLLTREELDFITRGLKTSGEMLKNLRHARGHVWKTARDQYEANWRELQERSRRIRADGAQEEAGASPS